MAAGNAWGTVPAPHVLIRPRNNPGGTGGYFADTSAAYEKQALVRNGIRLFAPSPNGRQGELHRGIVFGGGSLTQFLARIRIK